MVACRTRQSGFEIWRRYGDRTADLLRIEPLVGQFVQRASAGSHARGRASSQIALQTQSCSKPSWVQHPACRQRLRRQRVTGEAAVSASVAPSPWSEDQAGDLVSTRRTPIHRFRQSKQKESIRCRFSRNRGNHCDLRSGASRLIAHLLMPG
jgi:hypothetical protein